MHDRKVSEELAADSETAQIMEELNSATPAQQEDAKEVCKICNGSKLISFGSGQTDYTLCLCEVKKMEAEHAMMQSAFKFKTGTHFLITTSLDTIRSFITDETFVPKGTPYAQCPLNWSKYKSATAYHLAMRAQHDAGDFVPEHSTPIKETTPPKEEAQDETWILLSTANETIGKLNSQLADKDKRIAELERWKKEQLEVTADFQAIGKEIGVKLGASVHDKILPAIQAYKQRISTLEAEREKVAGESFEAGIKRQAFDNYPTQAWSVIPPDKSTYLSNLKKERE